MIALLRSRTRLLRLLALVLSATLAGCFSYVPVAGPVPDRGARVRVHLARPAEFRLPEVTANQVATLTGEVIELTQDELLLSVWSLESATGYEHTAAGETLRVDRDNIASVEQNRMSTTRSLLLAGGLLLGGVLFIGLAGASDTGGGGRGGGTPSPQ